MSAETLLVQLCSAISAALVFGRPKRGFFPQLSCFRETDMLLTTRDNKALNEEVHRLQLSRRQELFECADMPLRCYLNILK